MVKLITGLKGSGKTKTLIGLVCSAILEADGDVVVVEKERKLTYDIPRQARLIDAGPEVGNYDILKGFIYGIHAGNYDITHLFIDNFFKLVNDKTPENLVSFVNWANAFAEEHSMEIVISVSIDNNSLPEELKSFVI